MTLTAWHWVKCIALNLNNNKNLLVFSFLTQVIINDTHEIIIIVIIVIMRGCKQIKDSLFWVFKLFPRNKPLTLTRENMESSDFKNTLLLVRTHGCLQVPKCDFSALLDAHGLFKTPERVSRRWIAHTSGSRLGTERLACFLRACLIGF